MNIVALLSKSLGAGGGFDQGLNALLQMQRLARAGGHTLVVLTTEAANLALLAQMGFEARHQPFGWADRLLARSGTSPWLRALVRRRRWVGPTERTLQALGCDLAYYVAPDGRSAALQRTPYIATVMDLCHRDQPEFPEVREYHEVAVRDDEIRLQVCSAVLTLCDAPESAAALARRYGADPQRLLAMPYSPSPALARPADPATEAATRAALGLGGPEPYLFYPAQFWAHKNHVRILQALALLRDGDGWQPLVAFAGRDWGNLAHVRATAAALGVESQLRVLGFVPGEALRALYAGALAVVMPTYFGPTNLPPLEAWTVGTPLLYPAHLSGQAGDAALPFDADDAASLAAAMRALRDDTVRARLVQAGHDRLATIDAERVAAEAALSAHLARFAARRGCWGRP
jgi:glycosyltransferase involved in cell wall biosynthesis